MTKPADRKEQLGDEPIEAEHTEFMNKLAHLLDQTLNGDARGADKKVGFVVIVFNFGDDTRANYISNARRADVVTMLKHQIARFEGQPDAKGTA